MSDVTVYFLAVLGFMLLIVITAWIFFFTIIDRFQYLLGEKIKLFSKKKEEPEEREKSSIERLREMVSETYPPNVYSSVKYTISETPKKEEDSQSESDDNQRSITFEVDDYDANFIRYFQSAIIRFFKLDLSGLDTVFNPLYFSGDTMKTRVKKFLIASDQEVEVKWPETELPLSIYIGEDNSISFITHQDKFGELQTLVASFTIKTMTDYKILTGTE